MKWLEFGHHDYKSISLNKERLTFKIIGSEKNCKENFKIHVLQDAHWELGTFIEIATRHICLMSIDNIFSVKIACWKLMCSVHHLLS